MRMMTFFAMSALSLAAATPVLSQDAMMKDEMKSEAMTKMSAADMRKLKACKAMSPARMKKNAGCTAMMKAHPDMMKSDAMMKKGN